MLIDKVSNRQPRSFRSRFRGYAPDQVDEELTAMDEELRAARADVEATSRRCEHLAETLDQTRADRDALLRRYQELAVRAEEMEAELARLRPDPDKRLAQTPAALHMQRLIETAEDEATIIRRAAIEQSEQLRERAEDLLRRRVELVEQTELDAQRCMAKAAEQADQIVQQAVEQSQLLLKEIQERQAAFDASYAAFEPTDLVPAPRQDAGAEQEQPADV
jgi:cell division septum initiation protein DivIVA